TVVALSRLRGPIGGSETFSGGPSLTTVVGHYTQTTANTTAPAGASLDDARRKAYNSFFSNSSPLDTKLLGIVKLKDLVKHFRNIKPASEGLPQLREVVSYGLGDTSGSGLTIRRNVIDPLNKAVAELQSRWR